MKPEYDYISGYSKDKMYYKQNGRYAVIDKNKSAGPCRFGPSPFHWAKNVSCIYSTTK